MTVLPPPAPMTRSEPQLLRLAARARGAMLAAACGDALGWREGRGNRVGGTRDLRPDLAFMEWTRREGGGYAPYERLIPAGTYSDDTQLMLAVARSLTRGQDWWSHLTGVELPLWTLYELGGGGAVKRAANSWAKAIAPWALSHKLEDRRRYFAAGANGAAMRVLPHAIARASDESFTEAAEYIVADGLTTHGHPRALVGALVAGYAMWVALRWDGKVNYGEVIDRCAEGYGAWSALPEPTVADPEWADSVDQTLDSDYARLWHDAVEEMLELLQQARELIAQGSLARDSQALQELGAFGDEGGSGTRTTAAALFLASRYAAQPPAGLLAAAFARKSDTDTIAAITGGLLGCLTDGDWVDPIARGVQDADYISRLADDLAHGRPHPLREPAWSPSTKRALVTRLSETLLGEPIELPIFGSSRVSNVEQPQTRSSNNITIWWLETELGQKLSISRISRPRPETATTPARDGLPEPPIESLPADAVWTTIVVDDLPRATVFYRDILGLPLGRHSSRYASFGNRLLLERHDPRDRDFDHVPSRAPSFAANQFVTIVVDLEQLEAIYHRAGRTGCYMSNLWQRADGDRFRIVDPDGNTVELRARRPV